jgi:hypothetical protein
MLRPSICNYQLQTQHSIMKLDYLDYKQERHTTSMESSRPIHKKLFLIQDY